MTVSELIEKLQKFDGEKLVIVDDDGNTWGCPDPEIWNENDPESPIAFYF